jgi:hypothetical protein
MMGVSFRLKKPKKVWKNARNSPEGGLSAQQNPQ